MSISKSEVKGGESADMTANEYIKQLISVWGEDYVYDLIDRGYTPVELTDERGGNRWKLVLTQPCACATLAASPSVVSPVSTE